jgi:hypothetical protein
MLFLLLTGDVCGNEKLGWDGEWLEDGEPEGEPSGEVLLLWTILRSILSVFFFLMALPSLPPNIECRGTDIPPLESANIIGCCMFWNEQVN